MGVRRVCAALTVVAAVLLGATTLVAGRAAAGVTTPFGARFHVDTNGSILLRGNSNLTCLLAGQATCPQARNGTLYLMCGGEQATFDKAKPVLAPRLVDEAGSAAEREVGEGG